MKFFSQNEALTSSRILKCFKQKSRYSPVRKIGEGGLARVSKAFDAKLNRFVALKELKPGNKKNLLKLYSFVTEAKLTGYLDHPGVIAIYDTYLREDTPCYAMKLIDGTSLTVLMEDVFRRGEAKRYPFKFLDIIIRICETMAYVHDKGVIHLDLKPDNIMIGRYGEVMIMDWGNARLFDDTPFFEYLKECDEKPDTFLFEEEPRHIIVGTPMYMSPEQTTQSKHELSPASDLFSVGIIVYQMLTGRHPFPAGELEELLEQVRSLEPEKVHHVNPEIPLRLSYICAKMLKKKKEERYARFHDVLDDITDFRNSWHAFVTRTYDSGEVIFQEGDRGEYAFTILSGTVEIAKQHQGKKVVLAELGRHEIVGELSIFAHQPRTATATALTPTTVKIMNREDVELELEKLSPWVGKMIVKLSERFIGLNEKVLAQQQHLSIGETRIIRE